MVVHKPPGPTEFSVLAQQGDGGCADRTPSACSFPAEPSGEAGSSKG